MEISLKNAIFRLKRSIAGKSIISLIMVAVMAVGGIEIFIPRTSGAEFLIDNSTFLSNISIAQDNTLLSTSNIVNSSKTVRKIKMIITAYSSTYEETDDTPFITASGDMVRDGIVANNLLPFGTKVRIPELYSNKIFVVQDRMNQRKGSEFDSHPRHLISGSSSAVECLLAKEKIAGANPVSRSNIKNYKF